ncbi:ThuA-like domain-containing protein [Chaetomium strumarium]|uniref:ThuA-like domain-containing protein n=1 Tax=Chaetomium strumarium TaxID=1170767 RepID=A0AAJ0GZU2_9PEZI|nr:ThuA-like domain-containing protein [Chaetomium strumarium]
MATPFKILIFSRTTAYRHESIPAGIRALQRLASASLSGTHPFTADDSEDPALFNPASLSAYRVIVLLQCSGDILDDAQLDALKGYVRSGGGVVAIHCASFAMQSSEWYGRLIGGVFDNHPDPQPGRLRMLDPSHPIMTCPCSSDGSGTRAVEEALERTWVDEWYNFKTHPRTATVGGNLHVLLSVDERSYNGGEHGDDHPVAWCQSFDGGRCFYTSLGHFDEAYDDEWFTGQLLGGILWAAGFA